VAPVAETAKSAVKTGKTKQVHRLRQINKIDSQPIDPEQSKPLATQFAAMLSPRCPAVVLMAQVSGSEGIATLMLLRLVDFMFSLLNLFPADFDQLRLKA
jgi:hypothetical protein